MSNIHCAFHQIEEKLSYRIKATEKTVNAWRQQNCKNSAQLQLSKSTKMKAEWKETVINTKKCNCTNFGRVCDNAHNRQHLMIWHIKSCRVRKKILSFNKVPTLQSIFLESEIRCRQKDETMRRFHKQKQHPEKSWDEVRKMKHKDDCTNKTCIQSRPRILNGSRVA